MPNDITDSQRKTLNFLEKYIQKHGYAPKLPEIAEGIGIKSTGVVHRYVHALADKGYISINSRRHRGIELLNVENTEDFQIPLIGEIAAGLPIEALPDQQSIDFSNLFHGADLFALRVKGDSMIELGIHNGDWVICNRCNTAENGQIVVALIDNEAATLKRLKNNHDGSITLLPANSTMRPMHYRAERVAIQGIVVGQVRCYR